MKSRKSILAIALTLILLLLVGCAQEANQAPSTSLETGTLILSVNPSIAVKYDEQGKVINVVAVNNDGKQILEGFSGFEGQDTKQVVVDLVQRIGNAGYLVEEVEGENRTISLEIERGSRIPHEQFISEIASNVKEYLASVKLDNDLRVPREDDSNYDDMTDYKDSNYDDVDSNYDDQNDDSPYDDVDSNYDDQNEDSPYDDTDSDYGQQPAPVIPTTPVADTDYDDSDYGQQPAPVQPAPVVEDSPYDDSDYGQQPAPVQPAPVIEDSPYDDDVDSDYDDSGYDDSGYDD